MERKTKKLLAKALLFILLALVGWGCKDKEKPNPCKDAKPLTADFSIKVALGDTLLEADTVFMGNSLVFSSNAEEKYDTYTWKIGEDTRTWTTKSVSLFFPHVTGIINVTLIVEKYSFICFPNEPKVDTLTKSFYLKYWPPYPLPETEAYLYEGTFEGYYDNKPQEIFEIKVINYGKATSQGQFGAGLRIFNLPKGCGGITPNIYEYTPQIGERSYKHFNIPASSNTFAGCIGFEGVGWIDKNDKNKLYIYNRTDKKTFIGRRK